MSLFNRARASLPTTVEGAVAQPTPYLQHYALGRWVLGMDPIAAGINALQHDNKPLTLAEAAYIAAHWNLPSEGAKEEEGK